MDKFLAKYTENGIQRTVVFSKSEFDKTKAENWLNSRGIKNFFFFFEPINPVPFDENNMLIEGEVGFDITTNKVLDVIKSGKGIILKTYGGDLDEGLRIYDAVKLLGVNPSIGVLGTCASSGMQILLSTENRWATPNSLGLIHNPWTCACGDDAQMKVIANELEKSKLQIANIYASVSGKTTDEILAIMKEERFMGADEMLSMNFIKEIKTNLNNSSVEQKNDDMTNNEELMNKVSTMEKVINGLKNLFADAPKINNIILTEATGKEIEFPELEDESQIAVGVTANIDGAPANGEFVMAGGMHDGKTLVFEAGKLTEIKEPTPETNEEMEALKAENKLLKQQIEAQNAFRKNAEKQINEMTAQIAEFKNLVKTSGFENDVPDLKDKNKQPESFVFKGKKQTKS